MEYGDTTLAMAKEFDIVVFGASGFTGQLVVEEVAKDASQEKIKWAVAGRNVHKVQLSLMEVQKHVPDNVKSVKIFETDVTNRTSLELMCKSTKLVINCVGPYEKYGELVVEACLKYGTHVIDMTVELVYLHRMILKYFHEAESQGVYIISACGIGYLFYEMAIPVVQQKFQGDIDAVEFHVTPNLKRRSIHFATWESIVNMSDGISNIVATRQKVYSEIIRNAKSKRSNRSFSFPFKRTKGIKGTSLLMPSVLNTIQFGLDMRENASKQQPIKVSTYFNFSSFWTLILVGLTSFIIFILLQFSYGRRLLTSYPEVFTRGLVTRSTSSEAETDSSKANFFVVARGWHQNRSKNTNPDKTVVFRGYGPPAYRNTAICLVQAAITILQETDRLPNRGGVYTSGAAFPNTSLPSRLHKHGITYEEK